MSLIMLQVLKMESKEISGEIYNAGATSQNYMKKEIVGPLKRIMPQLKTKFIGSTDDRRDYRVSFEKFESLTGFMPTRSVEEGYKELLSSFHSNMISKNDYSANNLEAITKFFAEKENNLAK